MVFVFGEVEAPIATTRRRRGALGLAHPGAADLSSAARASAPATVECRGVQLGLAAVGGLAITVAVSCVASLDRADTRDARGRAVGGRAGRAATAAVGGVGAGVNLAAVARVAIAVPESVEAAHHGAHTAHAGARGIGGRAGLATAAAVREVGVEIDARAVRADPARGRAGCAEVVGHRDVPLRRAVDSRADVDAWGACVEGAARVELGGGSSAARRGRERRGDQGEGVAAQQRRMLEERAHRRVLCGEERSVDDRDRRRRHHPEGRR